MNTETVIFNGIKFRRYPKSKHEHLRRYFTPGGHHAKRGVSFLHREVWKFHNGTIPEGFDIHHIDGNHLNNQIKNLEPLSKPDHRKLHPIRDRAKHMKLLNRIRPLTKAWHGSEEGIEWHRQHAERYGFGKREGRPFICSECGKSGIDRSSDGTARLCSRVCTSRERRRLKLDYEDRTCDECGSIFRANKYAGTRFCGRSCAAKARTAPGHRGFVAPQIV